MPIPYTPPSAGVTQPTYDQLGNKLGATLIQPPDYYGTSYSGSGALTIPGVTSDPWGYNKTMTNIVSDPFGYGVNNFSGLNADQQSTAKTVQDAFNRSLEQHGRETQRYSMPALASFGEDAALARARTTASLINSNQQAGAARNAYLDAVNKSPTTMQNIAGLLSLIGGGLNLANQSGLLGLIKNAISGLGTSGGTTYNAGTGGLQTGEGGTQGSADWEGANASVPPPITDTTTIPPNYDYGINYGESPNMDVTIPEFNFDWLNNGP